MKNTLEQAQTPLDCRLEAVLPAVHQHFDALRKGQVDLDVRLSKLADQHVQLRSDILDRLSHRTNNDERIDSMSAILHRFQNAFEGAIGGFGSGLSTNGMVAEVAPVVATATVAHPAHIPRNDNEPSGNPPPVVKLQPAYKDFHAFYGHWYGLDDPNAEWSIAKLEETTKGRWRKSFTTAEKIMFSRASRIIQTIKLVADQNGQDSYAVLSEWNDAMKNEKRSFTVSGMQTWLAQTGVMKTKMPRGAHSKK